MVQWLRRAAAHFLGKLDPFPREEPPMVDMSDSWPLPSRTVQLGPVARRMVEELPKRARERDAERRKAANPMPLAGSVQERIAAARAARGLDSHDPSDAAHVFVLQLRA